MCTRTDDGEAPGALALFALACFLSFAILACQIERISGDVMGSMPTEEKNNKIGGGCAACMGGQVGRRFRLALSPSPGRWGVGRDGRRCRSRLLRGVDRAPVLGRTPGASRIPQKARDNYVDAMDASPGGEGGVALQSPVAEPRASCVQRQCFNPVLPFSGTCSGRRAIAVCRGWMAGSRERRNLTHGL